MNIVKIKRGILGRVASVVMMLALVFSSVPAPAYAVLYAPGATLNPSCLPTDTSCGIQQSGQSISAPTNLSVTPQGTTGATTYSYRVSSVDSSGGETVPTTATTTTVGNATLSAANYNAVSWTAASGASHYRVYGRTSGSELFIASTTATSYLDIGATTPSGTAPTSNTTGALSGSTLSITGNGTFGGALTVSGSTSLASLTTSGASTLQGALTLSALGGGILQTNASGQVSTTSLASLTTNGLSISGNVLTSTVNGKVATSTAVGSNGLSFTSGVLTSTINGVSATTSIATQLTGSQGQTITFDGSGNQVATSTLFLSSIGNVGIGTTNPSNKLAIAGTFGVVAETTTTNPNLVSTGAASVDTTTVAGQTIIKYNGNGSFTPPTGVTSVHVLAVGGGGGGGSSHAGGGGGAGRLVENNAVTVTSGSVHTITVGSGGAGGAANTQSRGGDGVASSFGSLVSAPGGGGGGTEGGAGIGDGKNGGNGGGASGTNSVRTGGTASSGTGGGGTTANNAVAGYGSDGGAKPGTGYGVGAGGGGANAVGGNGADTGSAASNTVNGGSGGAGRSSDITGVSTTYAGGGGGGGWDSTSPAQAANGGSGGGGRGGSFDQAPGNGTANTGGGGGGSHADGSTANNTGRPGGSGGSGVVIVRFATVVGTGATSNTLLRVTDTSSFASTTLAIFENSFGMSCIIEGKTTSLACSSDKSLKKNIGTIDGEDALGAILALDPVKFDWILNGPSEDDYQVDENGEPILDENGEKILKEGHYAGFIAQDVEQIEILRGLVTDVGGKKALQYDRFVPFIVRAFQTFTKKVDGFLVTLESGWRRLVANELCLLDEATDPPSLVCVTADKLRAIGGGTAHEDTVEETPVPETPAVEVAEPQPSLEATAGEAEPQEETPTEEVVQDLPAEASAQEGEQTHAPVIEAPVEPEPAPTSELEPEVAPVVEPEQTPEAEPATEPEPAPVVEAPTEPEPAPAPAVEVAAPDSAPSEAN